MGGCTYLLHLVAVGFNCLGEGCSGVVAPEGVSICVEVECLASTTLRWHYNAVGASAKHVIDQGLEQGGARSGVVVVQGASHLLQQEGTRRLYLVARCVCNSNREIQVAVYQQQELQAKQLDERGEEGLQHRDVCRCHAGGTYGALKAACSEATVE